MAAATMCGWDFDTDLILPFRDTPSVLLQPPAEMIHFWIFGIISLFYANMKHYKKNK